MNPQPVSLADELRRALARGYCHAENSHKVLDGSLIEAMREEIEALLRQHAVAEPQNEKWHGFIGGLNGKPEFCKFCGEPERSYRHAAHAAEQPKLTWQVLRDACESREAQNLLTADDEAYYGTILTALLASPVAPPPPQKEKK